MTTSFSPISFSPASFGISFGGATELTAPSGMRRLMLYQLQEEYLNSLEKKKDEQVKGQEAPRREGEAPEAKPVATPAAKPKRPRRQRVAEPTVHERVVIPFRRKPTPTEKTIPEKLQELEYLPNVSLYVKIASAKIIQISEQRNKRRRARRRAAAFLLLAA